MAVSVSSKAGVAYCVLCMLLVSALLAGPASAREIGYGAVGEGDKDHKCKGAACEPGKSRDYDRGCNPSEGCRGGKPGSFAPLAGAGKA